MAGLIKSNVQLGDSATATQNFTLSVPATPDGTVKLARGNSGATTQDILTVDASGLVAHPQGTYGGLRLMTAVASTSGTAIDFTGIPSWAKRITVTFNQVSTSGTSLVQIQIGSGSFVTSNYIGSCGNVAANSAFSSGFIISVNNAATDARTGVVVLALNSGNSWAESGVVGLSIANAPTLSGGIVGLGGALDRIRITTVNGTDTFDAGAINIMYEG